MDRTLIRCYHSGPEWTWERWQWRGTSHSPKFQHHWNLTIRLFSVTSRTLVGGGGLTVSVFYSPSRLGKISLGFVEFIYTFNRAKNRLLLLLLLQHNVDCEMSSTDTIHNSLSLLSLSLISLSLSLSAFYSFKANSQNILHYLTVSLFYIANAVYSPKMFTQKNWII